MNIFVDCISGGSRSQPGGGVSRGPKGRVGRVREGRPLPLVGVRGGLPRENFEKMVLNGAIWSVNKAF